MLAETAGLVLPPAELARRRALRLTDVQGDALVRLWTSETENKTR